MEPKTIAEAHKEKQINMNRQLDIDIALAIMRSTPDQIENLIENNDRHFNIVRHIPAGLQGISCDGLNVELEFEDYNGTLYNFEIQELGTDDKIYLLEEIEKL